MVLKKEDLKELKRQELMRLAAQKGLKNYFTMTKERLIKALSALFEPAKKLRKKPFRKELKKIPQEIKLQEIKKIAKAGVSEAKEKQAVEEPKFYLDATPDAYLQPCIKESEFNIPPGYGDNRVVLMVRDPWWLYAYWEISPQIEQQVKSKISHANSMMDKSILRIYDVTDVDFNGENANRFFDIVIVDNATNWYINTGVPNRDWCVDIGILDREGRFYLLARSNRVSAPRFGPSEVIDEEWMSTEEDYWKLFGVAGGFGIGKSSLEMKELFKKWISSPGVFSPGISSPGIFSPGIAGKEKKFWLWVDCELIVYGATEPDAKLTVQGRPIKLRPDGTFSLRFALPNGKQIIPVEAVSPDNSDYRKITPVVTRKTE